ncbi:MAG: DUF2911 domain-containing protein [Bacteroidota bacterium]
MITTILTVLGVLVIAFVASSIRGRKLSPPGTSHLTHGDLTVEVRYSRPSVRGRVIFGTKEEKAVVKLDKYWRLGANRPTTIRFSHDSILSGHSVPAGTYHLYAIPGKNEFVIGLNKQIRTWGSSPAKPEADLCRITIPVTVPSEPVEQFTIALLPTGGMTLRILWANVQLDLPVSKA